METKSRNNCDNFSCEKCKFVTDSIYNYNKHINTQKHKKIENGDNGDNLDIKNRKEKITHLCEKCNYSTTNQFDYNKHLLTKKHNSIKKEISNKKLIEITNNLLNNQCDNCKKIYSSSNNLWKHKQKCSKKPLTNEVIEQSNQEDETNDKNNVMTNEMIMEIIKQNQDIKTMLLEQQNTIIELSKNQVSNNTTINNSFNLNLFLNEKCKNAISISEFIDSIHLSVNDLEETGRLGFVDGISRIFLNKLQELDIYTRPLHCTDIKRETVYIKEESEWEKENDDKSKLKHIVRKIARKNLQQLPVWQSQNPDFSIVDTPKNNEYIKISLSSLGAYEDEEVEKQNDKIIRNVLREVVLEKNKK